MNVWNFVADKFPLLIEKTLEQIYLAGTAILLAMIISIPLGIFIARKIRIRQFVLATTGILQTIPSLALLGFLLPFLGIGIKTAIVTLTVYALLPILRNTVAGIVSVAPSYNEAADGLGFTKFQKMCFVELPLALPVIVAGIRTATAMSVGIATLAAFIGAGGLGDFIYEGLSLNNTNLLLLGAIPAALLALVLDFFISRIEKMLTEHRRHRYRDRKIYVTFILSFALLALLFFVPFYRLFFSEIKDTVRVGSKNFSEQLILGEMVAQLLEAKTKLKVVRKLNLGGTLICHQALLNNQIDLYPEYTGTAYTVILKQINPQKNLYEYVKKVYQEKFQITWLAAFGFNNTNALAVKKDFATLYRTKDISDLLPLADHLRIGVSPDFLQREDGFLGLNRIYQLRFAAIRLMDPGLMYKAIQNNQVDIIMAFSTDARVLVYQLILLKDDKKLFPNYDAGLVVRENFIRAHPETFKVLQLLAGRLSNAVMQNLNYQVDVLKKTPADVAKKFLQTQHLI